MQSHLFRIIQVVNAGGDAVAASSYVSNSQRNGLPWTEQIHVCLVISKLVMVAMSKGPLQSQFLKKHEFLNCLVLLN